MPGGQLQGDAAHRMSILTNADGPVPVIERQHHHRAAANAEVRVLHLATVVRTDDVHEDRKPSAPGGV